MALPKLIAFDLDDTLWHPEMWLCSGTPFRVPDPSTGRVFCKDGEEMQFLGDARGILTALADPSGPFLSAGVKIVYVSRTSYPEYAFPLLDVMRLAPGKESMADVGEQELHQIYPNCKVEHFSKIHEASGIAYDEMLFFDNEQRNITDVKALGVKCVYTPEGLFWQHFRDGLAMFGYEGDIPQPGEAQPTTTD
eukprot:g5120.t1